MASITLEHVQKMLEKHHSNDPLLKRGIGKDWVCIVDPHTAQKLVELYDLQYGDHEINIIMNDSMKLERVTRRQTLISSNMGKKGIVYIEVKPPSFDVRVSDDDSILWHLRYGLAARRR